MNRIKTKIFNLSFSNKITRILWRIVWLFLFLPTPNMLFGWRNFLLRIFGAKIGSGSLVYPSARVWAPWNLIIGKYSCISSYVDLYNVDKIIIGDYVTVSQYSFLCTASHDYNSITMPLISAEIKLEDYVWITSDVYIGPGVTIGTGTVIGARSTVFNNTDNWSVYGGSPIRLIGARNHDWYC